jgi:hypothetical protein
MTDSNDLISPEYLEQLRLMRKPNHRPNWGGGGQRHVRAVVEVVNAYRPESVLDYGCGQGKLLEELSKIIHLPMHGYDPGMPQFSELPAPADLLVSTDVLEHIEPDRLHSCLTHIRSLTKQVAYINVHTDRANAILPDGRNAHLIQKPADWWQVTLRGYFANVTRIKGFEDRRPSFLCE